MQQSSVVKTDGQGNDVCKVVDFVPMPFFYSPHLVMLQTSDEPAALMIWQMAVGSFLAKTFPAITISSPYGRLTRAV